MPYALQSISSLTAIASCLFLTILFVSSVYLFPPPFKGASRNHSAVIQRRILSTSLASLISILFTLQVLGGSQSGEPRYYINLLDQLWNLLKWTQIQWTIQALALVCLLFLGPITLEVVSSPKEYFLSLNSWRRWWKEDVWRWISWRNCFFV